MKCCFLLCLVMLIFCIFQSSIIWKESGLSALMDIFILIYLLSILAINQPSDFFLLRQELKESQCAFIRLSQLVQNLVFNLHTRYLSGLSFICFMVSLLHLKSLLGLRSLLSHSQVSLSRKTEPKIPRLVIPDVLRTNAN